MESAQTFEFKPESEGPLNDERVSIQWKTRRVQKCGASSPATDCAEGPATLMGIQSALTYAASAVRR